MVKAENSGICKNHNNHIREKLKAVFEFCIDDPYCFPDVDEFIAKLAENGVTIQRWIPVSERLPEEMEWVLCACVDGEAHILRYDYLMDDWDIQHRQNACYGKGFVTHWMPLPTPPKGVRA